METLTIDLKKKKSFEIGQQGDHNALCIHFINMKNIGTNKKYIYYTIDGIENCVPLTNDRFIIGYPLTAHSGIASAQLISKLNDNSIIKLSNVFAMHIKESKGYKDSGEYPVDPNIQSSYDLLDDLINETKDLINNYNYATLMEKLTQASSEATTSAATAKKCADELKDSIDFINTLDDKVAAQDSKIEKIEASTGHITTKQNTKIAALQTRMSEFTSLKDGSTTGDAELIDARIGADGTKYPSAGDAMRAQVEQLNEGLENYIYKPTLADNNKFPRAKDGNVEWVEQGMPTDEQTSNAINNWLNAHPEATTTVLDESLTESKFTNDLKLHTLKDYITPEMFGAKGDGITDDRNAFVQAIQSNKALVIQNKKYLLSDKIELISNIDIIGLGGQIIAPNGAFTIRSETSSPYSKRIRYVNIKNVEVVGSDHINTGINVENFGYISFEGVTIRGYDTGLSMISGSESEITSCEIYDNNIGVYLQRNTTPESDLANIKFYSTNISNNINNICVIENARSVDFINCSLVNSGKGGIIINESNNLKSLLITFLNCQFENSQTGASVTNSSNALVTFKGCVSTMFAEKQFEINGGEMVFDGCIFSVAYTPVFTINNGDISCYNCNIKYWKEYIKDNRVNFPQLHFSNPKINLNPYFTYGFNDYESNVSITWNNEELIVKNGGSITYDTSGVFVYILDSKTIGDCEIEIVYDGNSISEYAALDDTVIQPKVKQIISSNDEYKRKLIYFDKSINKIVLNVPSGCKIKAFNVYGNNTNRKLIIANAVPKANEGHFTNGYVMINKTTSYTDYEFFVYKNNQIGVAGKIVIP